MPTLTQLSYIVALHRTGHFRKAAEDCNVSQPTLSTQIQKAEAELGVTLFDRRSTPVRPTVPGRKLIELAREVLSAHERLIDASSTADVPSGPFTLGIIPTLAPYVLPYFLRTFAERHPRVSLTVVVRPTHVIVEDIGAQRMDGAILATPLTEPMLTGEVLFYDPFYVYAHERSPMLADDDVDLGHIDRSDLWLLEAGHCFRSQVVHLCGHADRSVLTNVSFEGGSFETLRALIDASSGFTLVPETYARTLPPDVRRARIRPFRDRVPTREISLVAHRFQWKTDILHVLAEAVRETAPRSLPRELGDGDVLPVPDRP
ncbi:MAG: hydrogen peroxide-inducible genes activator [Myxococcota bacterium]